MPRSGKIGDSLFLGGLGGLLGLYLALILSLVAAITFLAEPRAIASVLGSPEIQSSIRLTLLSCTLAAALSLVVAIPSGYLLSRFQFRGKALVEGIVDIPIILPPLVIGLCLLVLFNRIPLPGAESLEWWLREKWGIGITFRPLAVVLAQFTVACAFAIRSLRATFDQLDPRSEDVARVLGCSRRQAFWKVTLPDAQSGILAAGTLAWARALGEFGPILIFAGATRGSTEVLSSSVFLEINIGNLAGAAAISLLMIALALVAIFLVRLLGGQPTVWRG